MAAIQDSFKVGSTGLCQGTAVNEEVGGGFWLLFVEGGIGPFYCCQQCVMLTEDTFL